MKLTKADIKQKRAELVEILLKIEKLKNEKTSLEKTLDTDFTQNESSYRNGIATENGVLMRKPSWKTSAKPIVELD
jgi:cell shape-determining protein MreC